MSLAQSKRGEVVIVFVPLRQSLCFRQQRLDISEGPLGVFNTDLANKGAALKVGAGR